MHFLEQWRNTMNGGDPWDQSLVGENPGYGPLFNVFAPLQAVRPLLPKVVFTVAWLGTAVAVGRLFHADPRSRAFAPAVLAYFALTPYFWVEIALYGHFDILPAAATLASVHLVLRARQRLAGVALGIAALLKVVPAIALPFLVAARPRRWKPLVFAFTGTAAVVLLASCAIWGASPVTGLVRPAGQESDLFSIFTFLRSSYSPLRLFADDPNVDAASVPLVAVAGLVLVVALAVPRAHPVISLMIAFTVIFALYKLGHPQFQMTFFVLAPYLFLTLRGADRANRLLLVALGAYVAWFSSLDVVYVLGGQLREPPWLALREILGLPTFLIAAAVTVVLFGFRKAAVVTPPRLTLAAPAFEPARPAAKLTDASEHA